MHTDEQGSRLSVEPISLHRYELLPERRDEPRRGDERRGQGRFSRDRRADDRRSGRPLAEAAEVRRVFPITEGVTPRHLRLREQRRHGALVATDLVVASIALYAVVRLAGSAPSLAGLAGAAVAVLLLCQLFGLYEADDMVLRRSSLDEAPRLLELSGLVAAGYWIAFGSGLGRAGVLYLWLGLAAALLIGRVVTRTGLRRSVAPERCLVIGDAEVAEHLRRKVAASRANASVVAALRLTGNQTAEALGGVEGLQAVVEGDAIDRVILAPASTDAANVIELVRICKLLGVRVSILPRLFEVVGSAVEIEELDGLTLLGVRRFGLARASRVTKRAFDLVGSAVGIVVTAPIMAATAIAVRLESPGPVVFRQVRVGRDGEHFHIFKFRTMVADAEARKADVLHLNEAGDKMFKSAADPRITKLGLFLRRTSLDELPQLFNVLRGEMSLVGPRPLVVDEDNCVLGLDRSRLHLTPGMTGPWQVLGSARVPMEEMVGIDYLYVANWSLWRDIKLLVRTVPHMLTRGGM